jgi:hypothetical protein
MKDPDEGLVSRTLDSILLPLRELEETLSEQEQQLRAELAAVQSERRKLRAVLRPLEPAPNHGKSKPPTVWGLRTRPYMISEKAVEEVRGIIAERFPTGEFNGAQVEEHYGLGTPGASRRDQITKALNRLRERNQIRLVKLNRGRGGGNTWVATERIGETP